MQKHYVMYTNFMNVKVHVFWEGHKILRNLHLTFDHSTYSQKLGEDFAKFCGLLRIYELYYLNDPNWNGFKSRHKQTLVALQL